MLGKFFNSLEYQYPKYNYQIKQYYLQTRAQEMKKASYHPKIPRKKIPNLINLSQKQIKSKNDWPIFFSKIQNSLKLLQQPVVLDKPKQNKNKYLSYRQTLSLRLKQLSKPKQRKINLTQTQLITTKMNTMLQNMNQYSQSIAHSRSPKSMQKYRSNFNNKPISLPLMYPRTAVNKSYFSIQNSTQNQNLSRKFINKTEVAVQQIAATTLLEKSFQQIQAIHREEVYKQFDKYLQSQNNQEVLPLPVKLSPKNNQNIERKISKKNSNLSQNQIKSPKQKRLDSKGSNNIQEEQLNNLTQISEMIIGGQPKIYEAFDKKLMEKIKIYRSRRPLKFNHQVTWK